MLESLTIENFAIIEHVSIDFSAGMTVLSGETGAGKSIIIDALGILCGGRGSIDLVRQGSDRLSIEGQFSFGDVPHGLRNHLADFGIEFDGLTEDLIIRREISQQGKNVIRVNGQLANVTLLKNIGSYLVDIHGQNEHQALLDNQQHLNMVDQFAPASFHALLAEYQESFSRYQTLKSDWLSAQTNEANQLQRLNFIEFQLEELEAAELVLEEDEQLEIKSTRLQSGQKISQNLANINLLFSESDESVLTQLNQVMSLLQEIETYHPEYPQIHEQIQNSYFELEELAHQIAFSASTFEEDDQSIDEVEARLSLLGQLKRKYGRTIPELIAYQSEIGEEIYQIKHREQYLQNLSQKLIAAYLEAVDLADRLHQQRQDVATELTGRIIAELSDLYMGNSQFEVEFHQVTVDTTLRSLATDQSLGGKILQLNQKGYDQVEFLVATNVGEPLKPLVRVASGGELSRFMLALKTVFSASEVAKTMVFDEIDTGVSGRVAQAIAEKIAQISQRHQVLCITHLAQVAAIASHQLYISKHVAESRTTTRVAPLNSEDRSEVLAQMMSGKVITKASLQMAREMLNDYQSKRS